MKRIIYFILFLLLPITAFAQVRGRVTGGVSGSVRPTIDPDRVKLVYNSDFQAVHDAFTTKPSSTYAGYWNTMVEEIGTYWDSLDVFYFYAVHTNTAGEALLNWKLPGTYNATAYNTPTFTAYEGFTGNGTTQYIDCNWNPAANGVNYVQNSASMIIYVRTNVAAAGWHGTIGNADNKNCGIRNQAGTGAWIVTNDNTYVNVALANSSGMFINTRTAAAVNKLYRNSTAIINATSASTGVPTHNPYCLACNDDNVAGGFRADQVACYGFGAGMSQATVTKVSDAINKCLTSMGKNVY